jgi:hypothetical protein
VARVRVVQIRPIPWGNCKKIQNLAAAAINLNSLAIAVGVSEAARGAAEAAGDVDSQSEAPESWLRHCKTAVRGTSESYVNIASARSRQRSSMACIS